MKPPEGLTKGKTFFWVWHSESRLDFLTKLHRSAAIPENFSTYALV